VDNETNSEGASCKDGGKMKVGDKVWVLCEVDFVYKTAGFIDVKYGNAEFSADLSDCKPVEPEAVEQPMVDTCTKTANDQLRQSLADFPFGEPLEVKQPLTSDPVNPSHYKQFPAEVIDIIEAAITNAPNNKAAGLHWQVLKYALRCWFKNGIEDLKKARWYLDRLIQEEEAK